MDNYNKGQKAKEVKNWDVVFLLHLPIERAAMFSLLFIKLFQAVLFFIHRL